MKIDELDAKIVELFTADADIGVLAASRKLGVARPTVQARLDKLKKTGVIQQIAPILNPAKFGFPVMAFVSVEISQNVGHVSVGAALEVIPEIVEMYTVSGDQDVLIRIVAESNDDLQRVLDSISRTGAVTRTRSAIVLQTHFQNRVLPLFNVVGRKRVEALER
ncbi:MULTISPECIES: Lrp/AsnC family transcriptional regulator [Paenarthrobacter]|uniref:Lrp/AsnC family transcriptional regulator n=1 Tax=Paenarthrobacter aromaticivorans TaxID=2849150 RepID=A0ABS6I192_9MICC|nr:Lrp/AsnC family transcriptional regulator [Paenarthrobacter sp. MMS21-TAE1-1]MBU8865505.1 Lrp/AsnC family transcriptional regulator [Paenarthrobacter sp. MMS21-TAE1-1]